MLLNAFKDLHKDIPDTKLILLGRGPEEKKLKRFVGSEDIANVTILDPIAHDKVPEIINCADMHYVRHLRGCQQWF